MRVGSPSRVLILLPSFRPTYDLHRLVSPQIPPPSLCRYSFCFLGLFSDLHWLVGSPLSPCGKLSFWFPCLVSALLWFMRASPLPRGRYSSAEDATLPQDVYRMLSRPQALSGVLRLRTSREFSAVRAYGKFFQDSQASSAPLPFAQLLSDTAHHSQASNVPLPYAQPPSEYAYCSLACSAPFPFAQPPCENAHLSSSSSGQLEIRGPAPPDLGPDPQEMGSAP